MLMVEELIGNLKTASILDLMEQACIDMFLFKT